MASNRGNVKMVGLLPLLSLNTVIIPLSVSSLSTLLAVILDCPNLASKYVELNIGLEKIASSALIVAIIKYPSSTHQVPKNRRCFSVSPNSDGFAMPINSILSSIHQVIVSLIGSAQNGTYRINFGAAAGS